MENKFLFNFRHFFLIVHLSRQYVVNKRQLIYTWTQLFIYACVYICTVLCDVEKHHVLSPITVLMIIIILITIMNRFLSFVSVNVVFILSSIVMGPFMKSKIMALHNFFVVVSNIWPFYILLISFLPYMCVTNYRSCCAGSSCFFYIQRVSMSSSLLYLVCVFLISKYICSYCYRFR